MTAAATAANSFYAAAANTPLAIAYGKARYGTSKAIAASAVAQIGVTAWAQELCAAMPKSALAQYGQQAQQAARNGNMLSLCPISGSLSSTSCPSAAQAIAKLRLPLVAINPLCYTALPTVVEAQLPLHMLVARLLYIAAQHGICRITSAVPLEAAVQCSKSRLLKALPMLQAVVSCSAERAARLPILALSPSLCADAVACASAITVWAMRCYSMLYADYGTSISDDDTDALTELDAMLNADERARQNAANREEAAARAARAAAAKRITSLSLKDAANSVCATMRKVTCEWADAVHGTKLLQVACPKPTIDAAWYSLLSNVLIKYFPDAQLVGNEAYAAYTLIQQHLDMLQLSHNQALAELGLLPEDSNELLRNVLNRYNISTESRIDIALSARNVAQPATERKEVANSQKALRNALVDAATVVAGQAIAPVAAAASVDGRKLTIAERIAATRAAQAKQ